MQEIAFVARTLPRDPAVSQGRHHVLKDEGDHTFPSHIPPLPHSVLPSFPFFPPFLLPIPCCFCSPALSVFPPQPLSKAAVEGRGSTVSVPAVWAEHYVLASKESHHSVCLICHNRLRSRQKVEEDRCPQSPWLLRLCWECF